MRNHRLFMAIAAVVLAVCVPRLCHSQSDDEEARRPHALAIPDTYGVRGTTEVRAVPSRVVDLSQAAQPAGRSQAASSAATTSVNADTGASLVLQTFQGPVNGYPPDPAMAVSPTQVIATVNSTINIYDRKGTLLSSQPISVFMFQPGAAVWDTHVYYDNNSGRFFVVCVTGNQSTTGSILLAISANGDARGSWRLYNLHEAKNAWPDFPDPTVTSNALVLSFMDMAPNGVAPTVPVCATEVIGLDELFSGSQNLKITRFDKVFSNGGGCNFAYTAVNYESGTTAYLAADNPNDSLAVARIDTSGTPTLDVFTIPVPHYDFQQGPVPQKGTSSSNLFPSTAGVNHALFRNGSLWLTQTIANNGNSGVRWYELDPSGRSVKQVGTISGLGAAWTGAIAVLPDNQADVVYTTSSANDYVSAGYAHRSAADPPNTMPVSGVFQAGSGVYTQQRWGDFFEAWADPDGQSAWGIAEYAGASNYGTAIVQLASAAATTVTPQVGVSVNPTSATVTAGDSDKFTVTVTAQNAGAVALSCSGLPTGATCAFNPATLSGSGNSELTITTAKTSALAWPAGRWLAMTFAAMFAVVLAPGLRRRTRGLCLLVMVCALAVLVACGGVSKSSNPTPTQPTPTSTTPGGGTGGTSGGGTGGTSGGGTGGTSGGTTTPPPPPPPPAPTPPPSSTPQTFAVTITATGSSGAKGTAAVSLTVK